MKRLILILLLATAAQGARWQNADRLRVVNPSDPQISPDGKTVALVVARANAKENRWDSDIVLVDVAGGEQRNLTFERRGIASPRWSPDGQRIAFLANGSADKDAKRQIWIAPMIGGDARRITDAPRGVQQFAWNPDGTQIGYVTADEPVANEDKNDKAFEIGDDDYLTREAVTPSHVWVVDASTGKSRRITSGSWSVPIAHPPGAAPSPLSWSPDGKWIAITRRQSPHSATPDDNRITYGCINVPADFYSEVLKPLFKGTSGIVYILPEVTPLATTFPAMPRQAAVTY